MASAKFCSDNINNIWISAKQTFVKFTFLSKVASLTLAKLHTADSTTPFGFCSNCRKYNYINHYNRPFGKVVREILVVITHSYVNLVEKQVWVEYEFSCNNSYLCKLSRKTVGVEYVFIYERQISQLCKLMDLLKMEDNRYQCSNTKEYNFSIRRYSGDLFNHFNTLGPRQNGCHFADNNFKCISLNENFGNSNKISLKYIH